MNLHTTWTIRILFFFKRKNFILICATHKFELVFVTRWQTNIKFSRLLSKESVRMCVCECSRQAGRIFDYFNSNSVTVLFNFITCIYMCMCCVPVCLWCLTNKFLCKCVCVWAGVQNVIQNKFYKIVPGARFFFLIYWT